MSLPFLLPTLFSSTSIVYCCSSHQWCTLWVLLATIDFYLILISLCLVTVQPFILYNIPSVDAASGRWSDPAYMEKIFGATRTYATEHSTDNHFMYFNHKLVRGAVVVVIVGCPCSIMIDRNIEIQPERRDFMPSCISLPCTWENANVPTGTTGKAWPAHGTQPH